MNRKLGHLIRAALFALPLALPGVALAQSATGSTDTASPPAQDTANKGTLDQNDNVGNSNAQGSSGMSSGSSAGTMDQTDKQNAGSLGNQPATGTGDYTPPAGSLDKSGSDINKKSDDTMNRDLNKESTDTTTTTKTKKSKTTSKRSSDSDKSDKSDKGDTSTDMNR